MATAVSTNVSDQPRKSGDSGGGGGGMVVYKPGEGYATRLGLMVVILAYVVFAARQWYYNWVFIRSFFENSLLLGFVGRAMSAIPAGVQIGGTVIIALGGLLLGYYYIYIKRRSAEFLIRTDTELYKVTWPKISPWFRPETQVWGATYVVLIVVVILTLFVLGVDLTVQKIADWVFYGR